MQTGFPAFWDPKVTFCDFGSSGDRPRPNQWPGSRPGSCRQCGSPPWQGAPLATSRQAIRRSLNERRPRRVQRPHRVPAMNRLTFSIKQGLDLKPEVVSVPFEDVERLMGVAVFGDDQAMTGSRKLARALLKAMETTPPATVQLTDKDRIAVHVGLTRVGQRGGLSQQLIDLRIACAPH
jgi:hypothetical protein